MEVSSASVYEAISVLAEVVIVFSIALMTRGIKTLREAHYELVQALADAAGEKDRVLFQFAKWLSSVRIWFPAICLVMALIVLAALAFSPPTPVAQGSILAVISFIFFTLMLFTFSHQQAFHRSKPRPAVHPQK